ncbi:isoamylase early set domain-containing protein [Gracilimonas mengyeensis]|uniref:Glycogen recognition site of AMP-activated protein kinase n=1 Tax=Gracilimonas mengyeensis TaxID=1302730 RepID=A0A521DL48_9BACT|nr:isoamylase early set domain-containing protein [Gracilimonas mengyeensis]SMO72406.1 Glycogen recognition site of AMP-activated protein kinase [Gracilimonas mengyeensis]
MISKNYTPKRTVCKVTFSLPEEWANEKVAIAGDFNDWDTSADELEKKDGSWETTLRLKPENTYRFKYFVDGERWENDDDADEYEANEFGTEDSVLVIGE